MDKESVQSKLEELGFDNVELTETSRYGNRIRVKFWCDPDDG